MDKSGVFLLNLEHVNKPVSLYLGTKRLGMSTKKYAESTEKYDDTHIFLIGTKHEDSTGKEAILRFVCAWQSWCQAH